MEHPHSERDSPAIPHAPNTPSHLPLKSTAIIHIIGYLSPIVAKVSTHIQLKIINISGIQLYLGNWDILVYRAMTPQYPELWPPSILSCDNPVPGQLWGHEPELHCQNSTGESWGPEYEELRCNVSMMLLHHQKSTRSPLLHDRIPPDTYKHMHTHLITKPIHGLVLLTFGLLEELTKKFFHKAGVVSLSSSKDKIFWNDLP